MENDERQLLEDATKRLDEITTDVDEEELSEELGSIVSDLKTSVKSLEFSSGRSIAEEEADMAADKLHDCIIDYSEIWEKNISKMDELEEEIIPDIERAVEELGQTNYEDYRNELDDQFGGVDISEDPDDKF
jgi:hypothetical protein